MPKLSAVEQDRVCGKRQASTNREPLLEIVFNSLGVWFDSKSTSGLGDDRLTTLQVDSRPTFAQHPRVVCIPLAKQFFGLFCVAKHAARLFDLDRAHACSTVVAEQVCIPGFFS